MLTHLRIYALPKPWVGTQINPCLSSLTMLDDASYTLMTLLMVLDDASINPYAFSDDVG